jgi:hypothetical protein
MDQHSKKGQATASSFVCRRSRQLSLAERRFDRPIRHDATRRVRGRGESEREIPRRACVSFVHAVHAVVVVHRTGKSRVKKHFFTLVEYSLLVRSRACRTTTHRPAGTTMTVVVTMVMMGADGCHRRARWCRRRARDRKGLQRVKKEEEDASRGWRWGGRRRWSGTFERRDG